MVVRAKLTTMTCNCGRMAADCNLAKLQNQLNALPLTHCVPRCVVGVKTVPHTVTGASRVPPRLKKKSSKLLLVLFVSFQISLS